MNCFRPLAEILFCALRKTSALLVDPLADRGWFSSSVTLPSHSNSSGIHQQGPRPWSALKVGFSPGEMCRASPRSQPSGTHSKPTLPPAGHLLPLFKANRSASEEHELPFSHFQSYLVFPASPIHNTPCVHIRCHMQGPSAHSYKETGVLSARA